MIAIVDELTELLHRERDCLMHGQIEKMERMQALKLSLFNKIVNGNLGQSGNLGELSSLAKGNMRLLEAAKSGIRSARARFDPSFSQRDLTTYAMNGRKRSITSSTGSFERRA